MSTRKRPGVAPRDAGGTMLALRHLVVLLNELEEVAGERSLCYCLVTQLQKMENISQCVCVKSEKLFYLKPQPAS